MRHLNTRETDEVRLMFIGAYSLGLQNCLTEGFGKGLLREWGRRVDQNDAGDLHSCTHQIAGHLEIYDTTERPTYRIVFN